MRLVTRRLIVGVLAFLVAAGIAAAGIVEERLGRDEIATYVRVDDVERVGNTVRARLENLSDYRLENLRLIVSESFRWKDEQHPGADDPSRAAVVMVTEPIPPRSSIVVSHAFPPRPDRLDGWFKPGVEVVAVERYTAEVAPPARSMAPAPLPE